MNNPINSSNIENSENELNNKAKISTRDLIKEVILFVLFLLMFGFLIAIIIILINGVEWLFANYMTVLYLLGYPTLLGVFILWVKVIKKWKFKEFLLGKPKIPEKGKRWIYIVILLWTLMYLIEQIILFSLNFVIFNLYDAYFWLCVYTTVLGASIVEELLFRGLLYSRCQDVYGSNRYSITMTREVIDGSGNILEKPLMTFEIPYATLFSSVVFTFWHVQYYLDFSGLMMVFVMGLLLCKTRNDWNSLIPGMIIHAMWNLYVQYNWALFYTEKFFDQSSIVLFLFYYDLEFFVITTILVVISFKLMRSRRNKKISEILEKQKPWKVQSVKFQRELREEWE